MRGDKSHAALEGSLELRQEQATATEEERSQLKGTRGDEDTGEPVTIKTTASTLRTRNHRTTGIMKIGAHTAEPCTGSQEEGSHMGMREA